MKLNKKVLAVTAILAVGILAGCGSSNSTAGCAASSTGFRRGKQCGFVRSSR